MKKVNSVLTLNKSYVPLHLVSWGKAVSLCYQDAARALDRDYIVYKFDDWLEFSQTPTAETYNFVHTVKYKIAVPEIIVLQSYNKLPSKEIKYSRQSLFEMYDNRCCYCGDEFKSSELTIEHVVPRSKGGSNGFENTLPACRYCNFMKGDKTMKEVGFTLKYEFRKPRWVSPLKKRFGHDFLPSWETFLKREDVLI